MSKIKYEFFDGEAEICAFKEDGTNIAEFIFPEGCEGFLSIDSVVVKVNSGRAEFDLRYLEDGAYSPALVRKNGRIILPKIKKAGKTLSICEHTDEYVRGVSLRERRLAERVKQLEEEIALLRKSVFGTTIF